MSTSSTALGHFFHQPVVARPVAVVREVDHCGVVGVAGLLQRLQQHAQQMVHEGRHAQVDSLNFAQMPVVHLV
ncbi:MAG: hypothetical protein R3A10_05450 [Caldilineaceae bacterium]